MWETRIIIFLILFYIAPVLSQEHDVHDVLYRSLLGDNVKGNYMGKVYNDQPEILYDDLYLVKRAVVSYKLSPLNVDDGSLPLPLNYNDIEVSFEIVGTYSGKSNSVTMRNFIDIRHIKYDYYKKKFEGISVDEPQFIACSTFIDHVYNTKKDLKNDGVEKFSDNHKNKILYYNLNSLIGMLESDTNQAFCSEGFSLVIERTPLKITKK